MKTINQILFTPLAEKLKAMESLQNARDLIIRAQDQIASSGMDIPEGFDPIAQIDALQDKIRKETANG